MMLDDLKDCGFFASDDIGASTYTGPPRSMAEVNAWCIPTDLAGSTTRTGAFACDDVRCTGRT